MKHDWNTSVINYYSDLLYVRVYLVTFTAKSKGSLFALDFILLKKFSANEQSIFALKVRIDIAPNIGQQILFIAVGLH